MIVKFLGFFDFIAAIMIVFSSIMPQKALFYGAGYLVTKGIFFGMTGDIASWLDIICGIYIVFLAYGLSVTFITIIILIYLVQKTVVSFL